MFGKKGPLQPLGNKKRGLAPQPIIVVGAFPQNFVLSEELKGPDEKVIDIDKGSGQPPENEAQTPPGVEIGG